MRIFTLDKNYSIVCNSESTRSGFRHIAVLHNGGYELARAKTCYYNRTWESFEYESVLNKIIEDNFSGKEKIKFLEVVKKLNYRSF